MDLKDYLGSLRDRWYLLVVALIVGAALGFGYASIQPDTYETTTSAYVSSQRGETVSELVQGSQYTQGLMQSYAELVTQPVVLQPVIEKLDLKDTTVQDLSKSISAEVKLNTVIVTITVSDTDPKRATQIADATIDSLADAVRSLSPKDGKGQPSILLTTVAPASTPIFPSAPNTKLITATAGFLGLVLAAIYAVLKGALDTRIRGEEDAERASDLAFLGSAPRQAVSRSDQTGHRPRWNSAPVREAYRRIAANLDFASIDDDLRIVMVTSAMPGEGKTTTAVNLAIALAERRHNVLLVDADLRRPRIADECGLDGSVGLTTVLRHHTSLEEATQTWGDHAIDVLVSGERPPNPTEIVSSEAMKTLLEETKEKYDIVVVDSAPVLPVSDSLTLGRIAGATVLVGRYKVARRQTLRRAVDTLEAAGARIVGLVLNAVPPRNVEAGYYEDSAERQSS